MYHLLPRSLCSLHAISVGKLALPGWAAAAGNLVPGEKPGRSVLRISSYSIVDPQ